MGKRRIRNLHQLGYRDIVGMDPRPDRREEANQKYGVKAFARLEEVLGKDRPDVAVVCSPPDTHMDHAEFLVKANIPCFLEASVVEPERVATLASRVRSQGLVVCPSCTMRYFPGPRKVRELLGRKAVGTPLMVHYQTGQFLPDWHPWESIHDYYVSRKETGGCREIVPFELVWLNEIFGVPQPVSCHFGKIGDVAAEIDDVYHLVLNYGKGGPFAAITIEVLSRPVATRELRIVGTGGILVFSQDEGCVRLCQTEADGKWQKFELKSGTVEEKYINPEEPYVDEMRDFLSAVLEKDPGKFPHTLERDAQILKLLVELEASRPSSS